MRLGFGLLPFQGFPVCGAISVGHTHRSASPLVKPDVRISRIRLARKPLSRACTYHPFGPATQSEVIHRRGAKALLWEQRSMLNVRRCPLMRFRQGPLARPTLLGVLATMTPSDSCRSTTAVMYSRRRSHPLASAWDATRAGLSGSLTNLSAPAVPFHPGEPDRCTCSCLGDPYWLHHLWKAGRSHLCHEAEPGSRLRITADAFGPSGSGRRIAPPSAEFPTWVTSISHGQYLSTNKTRQASPDAPKALRRALRLGVFA